MKTTLFFLALSAALAGSAAAAPYVLPSPQPGAYTRYDRQPYYSIEGLYSLAQSSDMPDTYGLRGGLNLYSARNGSLRHQFSGNLAASWVSHDFTLANGTQRELDLFLMPLTLGYNLNIDLSNDAAAYLGGKAGYAWGHTRETLRGHSDEDSSGGFTYSAGAGLKFRFSGTVSAHLGYEFGRSYLGNKLDGREAIYGAHTIVLGISGQF